MNNIFVMPLLKREIKSNCKVFLIIAAVASMYISVMVSMFEPGLGEMLAEFEKAMPGLMSAAGMTNPGTTLQSFLKTYLYGFFMFVLPMMNCLRPISWWPDMWTGVLWHPFSPRHIPEEKSSAHRDFS